MITSITPERLASSVLAVPPLCRNADLTLNEAENAKFIRYLEAGGIRTLLYGGNANFYHIALSEYEQVLSCLEQSAAADTLVIPSVAATFGTMMDQAKIVRKHRFPTVMILPLQGAVTSKGVEAGIRRFVDAAGIPALLYLKNDGYIEVQEVRKLAESKTISGIKYAIVRDDPANDPYLRKLCDQVDRKLIVSGLGEQPAIIHMRDVGLPGFTAGVVCVAPKLTAAMLKAIRAGDFAKAEKIREVCKPLEDHRNAINPVRVLHEAVRLAGIANTGPLLPLLSNLEEAHHARVRDAAVNLLEAERQLA
ncbi:MAG TPA: dihydrodipicolinate synthase family protein, partial [Tepidisphaeraceae bacterium]|nr:dihydrodipicolinate synthase family protein [Tepidisphaeraceae bacterium]